MTNIPDLTDSELLDLIASTPEASLENAATHELAGRYLNLGQAVIFKHIHWRLDAQFDHDDATSEAYIALVKGVRAYAVSVRKGPLSAYLATTVTWAVRHAFSTQHHTLSVPVRAYDDANRRLAAGEGTDEDRCLADPVLSLEGIDLPEDVAPSAEQVADANDTQATFERAMTMLVGDRAYALWREHHGLDGGESATMNHLRRDTGMTGPELRRLIESAAACAPLAYEYARLGGSLSGLIDDALDSGLIAPKRTSARRAAAA